MPRKRKKTPPIPQQCEITVTDTDRPKVLKGLFRATTIYPEVKRCSKRAKARLGKLCMCPAHVRMSKQGFISEEGLVESHENRRTFARYPEKWPGGIHAWAKNLQEKELP